MHDIFSCVRGMGADWDGYGADPPCESSINMAQQFWQSLSGDRNLPSPEVMATPDGGVYLEWDALGAVLVVEFGPDGEVDLYAKTSDVDVEGRLADSQEEFSRALLALSGASDAGQ